MLVSVLLSPTSRRLGPCNFVIIAGFVGAQAPLSLLSCHLCELPLFEKFAVLGLAFLGNRALKCFTKFVRLFIHSLLHVLRSGSFQFFLSSFCSVLVTFHYLSTFRCALCEKVAVDSRSFHKVNPFRFLSASLFCLHKRGEREKEKKRLRGFGCYREEGTVTTSAQRIGSPRF